MPLTGDSTLLVPVHVSDPGHPDRSILEFLRPLNLVLPGYYPVPKQTAPAHLIEDHEDPLHTAQESCLCLYGPICPCCI